MRRILILLLTFATCSWAATGSGRMHTTKDGAQFIVNEPRFAGRDGGRNPLDQGGEDCFSATEITSLPFCDTGTTAGYADDYFEECLGITGAPDVVYSFVPSVDMDVSIALTSSEYSTYLQIYETDTDCNNLWFYDCNNNSPTSCLEGITFFSGYTYYIVVDGDWQESGNYTLNVTEGFTCVSSPCGGGGGNGDICEEASLIPSLPYCDVRNTLNFNDDYFPECNSSACGERDVVYELVPTSDQFLGISVTSTEFQPHVEIWETWNGCWDRYLLGCANINSNGNSCITGVDVYAGYRYYIFVDGHECGGNGEYTLNVYQGGGCVYDTCSGGGGGGGETCGDAIAINSLPFSYSGTTLGMNNDYNFCSYENGAPDIVFSYTPQTTHLADILTCGNTQFESSVYIFRDGFEFAIFGECGIRPCYTFFGGFWQNAAMYCFEFEAGHDYCIVVDGAWSYSNGPFMLEINETSVETCDIEELCPAPLTETEPNNSCGQFDVTILSGGDTIAGNICEPGDADYFLVNVPEDTLYIVWVNAGPGCESGIYDLGNAFVYPDGCAETNPCAGCGWIMACGPETKGIRVDGLGACYTGPYQVAVAVEPVEQDDCDPVACTTASAIECNVPVTVNSCDGCATPICQTYRNGCAGDRGYTGPQKFYRLDVPATADYTVHVADDAQQRDVQFSIFTDCVLPRTTCVFSQDRNYWAEQPTGAIWEETGTTTLNPGTYFLHVSFANSECGDLDVLVTCSAAQPCLPPDSVTVKWTTANEAEIRFVSSGGTYEIYSTDIPNNDGDPRGGDPQWSLRHSANFSAGNALWTDTNVVSAYRNYVVLKSCP